ncbi:MAG: PepSY domain-containing protein [Cyanobacteria bacterium J06597_16]
MNFNQVRLRQLHRALVPFLLVPLLITLVTGTLFQMAAVSDKANDFLWLLELHRGKFGRINLEWIYPFLNALGLLTMVITGLLMWLRSPTRRKKIQ